MLSIKLMLISLNEQSCSHSATAFQHPLMPELLRYTFRLHLQLYWGGSPKANLREGFSQPHCASPGLTLTFSGSGRCRSLRGVFLRACAAYGESSRRTRRSLANTRWLYNLKQQLVARICYNHSPFLTIGSCQISFFSFLVLFFFFPLAEKKKKNIQTMFLRSRK